MEKVMTKKDLQKTNCLAKLFFTIAVFAIYNLKSQSCDYLNYFIPSASDSIKEVNFTVWHLKHSTIADPWSNVDQADVLATLASAESYYSSVAAPNINKSGIPIPPHITDSRIRFKLKNYNVVVDDLVWNDDELAFSGVGNPNGRYYDENSINIYLVTNYQNYPNSQFNLAVPEPIGWQGYGPANFIRAGAVGPTLLSNYGVNIAHEIGHFLGLKHVAADEGESYIKFPEISCSACDSSIADDYFMVTSLVGVQCSTGYSNNTMNRYDGCYGYLSPKQMAVMNYYLTRDLVKYLTPASYANATEVDHSFDYLVTSNEIWTTPKYLRGDITVKANKSLTISCGVAMTHGAKIIVERGGLLTVDGGTITNISGRTWDGIYLMGKAWDPQLTPNPSNPSGVLYQGMLRIKNGGTISQAEVGVRNYHFNVSNSGGVIFAQNANFINNVIDVQMIGLEPVGTTQIPSASWFSYCNFKTTGVIANNLAPKHHVELSKVSGLKFVGCVFKYEPNSGFRGNGIYSKDAKYLVDKNGSTPCLFENLDKGIYVNNINFLKVPAISNSKFVDNYYGCYFMNARYLSVVSNTFAGVNAYALSNIYLNNCKYYKIRNNEFSFNTLYTGAGEGVSVYKSKTGGHEIFRNTFSNLHIAINCMDDNGNPNDQDDGLKMNCNTFHHDPNTYDIALTYATGLAAPRVLINQGNISLNADQFNVVRNRYGSMCGNQNKWYIDAISTVNINHGSNTNSLTAVTQPTATGCKSSYLNVVDKNINLDYSVDCPIGPPSVGGTSTISSQRLSAMNVYIGDLKGEEINTGESQHFEIQSTVASKLTIFLTDTVEASIDSVITILENNHGSMEDADVQTIFAYMSKGDYTTAGDKATELISTKPDWGNLLTKLVALEQDSVNGINNLQNEDVDFFNEYAESEDKDGKALAQALLYAGPGTAYTEPHAVPQETTGARMMNTTGIKYPALENTETSIRLYPNPANTGVYINYSSKAQGTVKMEVRDLVGKVICTKFIKEPVDELYIPLEHLSKGLYLVTVRRNKEVIYKEKVIKE